MNEEFSSEGQKPTKVGKTWFIQRGQDVNDIFACEEQEAWALFHNRTNWMLKDFKIIGVSDGKTYVKTIKDSANIKADLENKVAELSREITKYSHTYDKFKYEELLSDDDPKVERLNAILKELNSKLEVANNELANIQKIVVEKAFKAELEVARGHIEQPTDHDVITPSGNREKLLRILGRKI